MASLTMNNPEDRAPTKAFALNSVLDRIAGATRGTVYEDHLFAVGGFLRDRLLGRWHGDEIDFVVEGDALALAGHLHKTGVASGPPVTYPRFGTAMLRVQGIAVELVTARRESYEERSRKPEVEPASVQEDAFRRDFTMNTLLLGVHSRALSDPTGRGLMDLARGVIRTPLDPDQTFFDDPLRMLRAARFSAQLGFRLEPDTAAGIRRSAFRLEVISRERIRDEWNKLLMSERPAPGVKLLARLGLLEQFLPEIHKGLNDPVEASGKDYTPALRDHTFLLLSTLPSEASLVVRIAAVLHHYCTPEDSGHVMSGLRYSTVEAKEVRLLLEERRRLVEEAPSTWSDGSVRRFVRRCGLLLEPVLQLCVADQHCGDAAMKEVDLKLLRSRVETLEGKERSVEMDSPLGGQEIMELLALEAGPRVREVKEWLLNEVLEGRLGRQDRDAARELLVGRFAPNVVLKVLSPGYNGLQRKNRSRA